MTIKTMLRSLNYNLKILQRHKAKYGSFVPEYLQNHVKHYQKAITLTEQAINNDIPQTEYEITIKPLISLLNQARIDVAPTAEQLNIEMKADANFYEDILVEIDDIATLGEAQAQLSALPLGGMVEPSALPISSKMPMPRNPFFVGREVELRLLAKTLKKGGTIIINQVADVPIMGGVGKTELVNEFAHRYGRYFKGGVFWFNFITEESIFIQIAHSGKGINIPSAPDFEYLDFKTQVSLVLSAWQGAIPRLLIFDGCEDESLFTTWKPPNNECRVLVTTNLSTWTQNENLRVITLDTLNRSESIDLLRKIQPTLTGADPDLMTIAADLNGFPLALRLVGGFLARYQSVNPANYLAQLSVPNLFNHPNLQAIKEKFNESEYILDVARTFTLIYNKLNTDSIVNEVALGLLARATYFAPGEAVSQTLLLTSFDFTDEGDTNPIVVQNALSHLVTLGLLKRDLEEGLIVHPIIALFVRNIIPEELKMEAQGSVMETLQIEGNKLRETDELELLLTWQVHLQFIVNQALEHEDALAADLCSILADYFFVFNNYSAAIPYYEKAITIYKDLQGEGDPNVIDNMLNLATIFREQGEWTKARAIYQQALDINMLILGQGHPHTANCMHNLALLMQRQGELEQAEIYFERVVRISRRLLGIRHLTTAIVMDNFASLLQDRGNYRDARHYYSQALEVRENSLGPQHPDVAISLNNMACLFHDEANYKQARAFYERALLIYHNGVGSDHTGLAATLNNFAALLRHLGEYVQARIYYEQALTIYQKALGAEHPKTAACFNNLGLLFRAEGNLSAAQQYYEHALAIREKVLGTNHQDTANSYHNLALLHEAMKEREKTKYYLQKAKSIKVRVYGIRHPVTANTLHTSALIYEEEARYEPAKMDYERALSTLKLVLDDDHPAIITLDERLTIATEVSERFGGWVANFKRLFVLIKSLFRFKR